MSPVVRILLAILLAIVTYWLCAMFLPGWVALILAIIVGILVFKYEV